MTAPEEDALVTALEGTRLDVAVDAVRRGGDLQTDRGAFVLSASGAVDLAEQLLTAARVVTGQEDAEQL